MSKTRKRPAADRANRDDKRQQRTATDSNRIPPGTPNAIERCLTRLYRRCDELADEGGRLSLSVAYLDTDGELVGILIADRHTAAYALDLMSPGVHICPVGEAIQA